MTVKPTTVNCTPSVEESLAVMTELYNESYSNLTDKEKKKRRELSNLVKRHNDNKFIMRLLDETYQIHDTRKIARRVRRLLQKYGIPKSLPFMEQVFFALFVLVGDLPLFCYMLMKTLRYALRKATKVFVANDDKQAIRKIKLEKSANDIDIEVCFMGEMTMGFKEADHFYQHCLETLKDPNVERLAVKMTSIYPHSFDLNFEDGGKELEKRISELYRTAMQNKWTSKSGTQRYKVVMIETESYREVRPTFEIFKKVLSQPEFKGYTAGVTLQAYLLDAWDLQTELLDFAKKRQDEGGAPLEMRLVKGRFHDVENMVSELKGLQSPVIQNKVDVEANYMRILDRAMKLENAKALRVGVATHNIYTMAYALQLSKKAGTPKRCFRFELLEGIANHVVRSLSKRDVQVLVHMPVVVNEEYDRAVAYIARRFYDIFDENTFLSKSYSLRPQTAVWDRLERDFRVAYAKKDKLTFKSVVRQDRHEFYGNIASMDKFVNEPDTDFGTKENRRWAMSIVKKWKPNGTMTGNRCDWRKWVLGDTLPTQIGDTLVYNEKTYKYYDHSQGDKVQVCEMSVADAAQMERVLLAAKTDESGWRQTSVGERMEILYKAANNIGMMRADLTGALCAIEGVTIEQADAEVSEAMNYCRLYSHFIADFSKLEGVEMTAKGVVLVLCSWMFPYSIPANGIVTSLLTGNSCIVKLSHRTAPATWLLANAFWNAGVPKDALQLCLCEESYFKMLPSSPFVNHIVMTGKTSTAESVAKINPAKSLMASTGSKNAIILTAKGDMFQAIRETCISAFCSAGQSCTACSILLVERSIYDNRIFQDVLADTAKSMKLGSVWQLGNQYGPLISNDNPALQKALELEPGERWLVAPEFVDEEKFLMRPAIKYDVKPTSYTFRTELDAPLLVVAPFDTLAEAIDTVNSLNYGLVSGLFSLDEKEQKLWAKNIVASGLLINRNISVLRAHMQPIGGMLSSSYGQNHKLGCPNYCLQMLNVSDKADSKVDYKQSYAEWYEKEFKPIHNLSPNIKGELNLWRYLPFKEAMALRLFGDETVEEVDMVVTAAKTIGTKLIVSADIDNEVVKHVHGAHVVKESLSDFNDHMKDYRRIRTISNNVPDSFMAIAAALDVIVISAKPVKNGRIELANYVVEQSMSHAYSRYGLAIDVPDLV